MTSFTIERLSDIALSISFLMNFPKPDLCLVSFFKELYSPFVALPFTTGQSAIMIFVFTEVSSSGFQPFLE